MAPGPAFANSATALPGGQFTDFLGTPAAANQRLAERGLAPADAGLREMCTAQLRLLREHEHRQYRRRRPRDSREGLPGRRVRPRSSQRRSVPWRTAWT
ncbi:ABATE domain-containing protein [Streptomyces lomondensis]|uniref:Uncharacterized protein n=1 Tax=Streptomyces lomondensis TaxID=68229 RepID=A0ABQ2WZ42_9ACTN|nr:ABATE domain-containing protein [Streptomyces lomondensis]GGW82695.1 hypothetical protein GCM10010383_08740 [Streptomyces lomondensis]